MNKKYFYLPILIALFAVGCTPMDVSIIQTTSNLIQTSPKFPQKTNTLEKSIGTKTSVPSAITSSPYTPKKNNPTLATTLNLDEPLFLYGANDFSAVKRLQCCGSSPPSAYLYLTNMNGSGRTPIIGDIFDIDTRKLPIFANPDNQLVHLYGIDILINPRNETAYIINGWPKGNWHSNYVEKDGQTGNLAIIEGYLYEIIPELKIINLPSGEVHYHFPLIVCHQEDPRCRSDILMNPSFRNPIGDWRQLAWSPDGRYLAYAAIGLGTSSDLYIYNSTSDSTQEMDDSTSNIGQIWWSPDGKWLLYESISPSGYALWSIRLEDMNSRQLFTSDLWGDGLSILRWLDNEIFLTAEGLIDGLYGQSNRRNLRLIDLLHGQVLSLYSGEFMTQEFDLTNGILVLYFYYSDNPGWYWLTMKDQTLRKMRYQNGYYYWDTTLNKFVFRPDGISDFTCLDSEYATWSVFIPDELQCMPRLNTSVDPEVIPSPDGLWQIRIEDGIWLITTSKGNSDRVGDWVSGQAIWRPDSKGFFLASDRSLFYVSVPDLSISIIDEKLFVDKISYQWLGIEKYY